MWKKIAYVTGILLLLGGSFFFAFSIYNGRKQATAAPVIPHLGSIQLLNGCGQPGVANAVCDFLRTRGFDVKETGNAGDWNYPFTIIASRTRDQGTAQKVAAAMHIPGNIILMEDTTKIYDVTVFIGKDYKGLIKDK